MSNPEAPVACPMCSGPFHPGRCPRPVRGTYWCTVCLATHLTPADLQAPPHPSTLLLATGIQRTAKWCQRCGSPICGSHRHTGKEYVRCAADCRTRTDAQVAALRTLTEKYNPSLPKEARCVVCSLPSYRRAGRKGRPLCQRHYTQVRKGKTELTTERQRKWSGHRCKIVAVSLPPLDVKLAEKLATQDDVSVSKWVADLVRAEFRRRLGVETEHAHTVFSVVSAQSGTR